MLEYHAFDFLGCVVFLKLMEDSVAGNQALLLCPQGSRLWRLHMFPGTSDLRGNHLNLLFCAWTFLSMSLPYV